MTNEEKYKQALESIWQAVLNQNGSIPVDLANKMGSIAYETLYGKADNK